MTIAIKWFPPSWIQIKTRDLIIYIDPAYLRTYFTKHPHKIEFSKWPDPIDRLPEKLEERADIRGLSLLIGKIYYLNNAVANRG